MIAGLLAFLFATAAMAVDLKLKDGRTLVDFQVAGQTATTVTVRYKGGMAKVEKALLPAELLAQYPVDEAGAAAEAEENAKGKAAYDAQRPAAKKEEAAPDTAATSAELEAARKEGRKDAELAAARREGAKEVSDAEKQKAKADAAIAAHNRAAAGEVSGAMATKVKAAVRAHVQQYFRTEYKRPASALPIDMQITIESPRAVPGYGNRYEAAGFASWSSYESNGRSFTGDQSWFEATVEINDRGTARVTSFTTRSSAPLR